jgi:release factor glutamine methyltransferase
MNTSLSVTNKEWLSHATRVLKGANISSPELDAIILLCFCLKIKKIELLSNPSTILTKTNLSLADKLLNKRKLGYPVAYLTKTVEFYNHSFFVDTRVLIPRPESESFINLLKTENISKLKYLTDLGCGSGILGIVSKIIFPNLEVELLDKSKSALDVVKINLSSVGIDANIILSDLLTLSNNNFDIILANLPYVPENMSVNKAASFEPKMAIFAKNDGLFYYKELLKQLSAKPTKPSLILIECLNKQLSELTNLFNGLGYELTKSEGLVHMYSFVSTIDSRS